MSDSPNAVAPASQKRPLEELSSSSGAGDQPDAKRPALNKVDKDTAPETAEEPAPVEDTPVAAPEVATDDVKEEPPKSNENEEDVNGKENGQSDEVVADAPAPAPTTSNDTETHPIQSTSSNGNASALAASAHQDESGWLHVRAVITSAEAATIIGKGGENVTQIRRLSNAKCTVSEYSRGQVERILTVSGLVDAVAKVILFSSHYCIWKMTDYLGIWSYNTNS